MFKISLANYIRKYNALAASDLYYAGWRVYEAHNLYRGAHTECGNPIRSRVVTVINGAGEIIGFAFIIRRGV
jgi:hypothetical protein